MNKPFSLRLARNPGSAAIRSARGEGGLEAASPYRPELSDAQGESEGKGLSRLQLASIIFLAWTAVALFESVPELLVASRWPIYVDKFFDAWAWALLTPVLMLIDRKLAARQTSGARIVVIYLLLSAPFSLIHTFMTGLFLYPIPQVWWSPLRDRDFAIYFFLGGWATYGALVGAMQAFRYHSRYLNGRLQLERVEKTLLQSRLQALRLHLEPHFLFNALNSISSEVDENPKLAREMISDLGALLRQSLDCQDKTEISLARELALLHNYLSIQKVRFGDRMGVKLEIEPDTLSAEVPSMLLQPLIENSIRHGIERKRSGGHIVISASKVGTFLHLAVADNGPGLPRDWGLHKSSGHGLRVTLERLTALYPEYADSCFSIGRRPRGGTQVIVRIPMKETRRDGPTA